MRRPVVLVVQRRLRQNERRRSFARRMVSERRTRRLRAARRWLAEPSGLSRGGLLVLSVWVLVYPSLGRLMEEHRAGVSLVLNWMLVASLAYLAIRLTWLLWHRKRRG